MADPQMMLLLQLFLACMRIGSREELARNRRSKASITHASGRLLHRLELPSATVDGKMIWYLTWLIATGGIESAIGAEAEVEVRREESMTMTGMHAADMMIEGIGRIKTLTVGDEPMPVIGGLQTPQPLPAERSR